MNDSTANRLERVTARVTGLEEMLTHFERQLGELDEVLQTIQTRMDALEGRVEDLTRNVKESAAGEFEERSPEDERPPHY